MPPALPDDANPRLRVLHERPARNGDYVLYWMQQSARAEYNHALEYAVAQANQAGLPLAVAFGLMDDYPEANARHYLFLLQGLRETAAAVRARGADFILQHGPPPEVALRLAHRAALLVCDRGYLRHQKAWRATVAAEAKCPVHQVESEVVVPVETASPKLEFAARTLRPKIHRVLPQFLKPLRTERLVRLGAPLKVRRLQDTQPDALLRELKVDRSVAPVPAYFLGGTSEAKRRLRTFVRAQLACYAEDRGAPENDAVSHLSAYLHFGQLSPLWLALQIEAAKSAQPGAAAYLEELIVRRELAMNFAEYNDRYDQYEGLPAWSRKTLDAHRGDPRPIRYTRAELEGCATGDPYWNAAMRQMVVTGYMHNRLRMYWGKKLLEWSATPEEGYETTLALNNKYFLCGRDAASFANVGWLYGLHDRPWGERPIYGQVRCMMASGLERKCDIRAYVAQMSALTPS